MSNWTDTFKATPQQASMMLATKVHNITDALVEDATPLELLLEIVELMTYDDISLRVTNALVSKYGVDEAETILTVLATHAHQPDAEIDDTEPEPVLKAVPEVEPVDNTDEIAELDSRIETLLENIHVTDFAVSYAHSTDRATSAIGTMMADIAGTHAELMRQTQGITLALVEIAEAKAALKGHTLDKVVTNSMDMSERAIYQRTIAHLVGKMGKALPRSIKDNIDSDPKLVHLIIAGANCAGNEDKLGVVKATLPTKTDLDNIWFDNLM